MRVTDKNFNDVVINSGKFTLVDFYADWCRHCMKLMPTIEQLAETYAHVEEIQIVKINGDEDGRKMTKKYDIPGFPMLLMFHGKDTPKEYEGLRDAEAISNFIQQSSGIRLKNYRKQNELVEVKEPSKVLSLNDENFENEVFKVEHKTMVAFTAPWCRYCKDLKPIWDQLANEIYDSDPEVRFATVDLSDERKAESRGVVEHYKVKTLPTILLFDPLHTHADGGVASIEYKDDRNLEFLIAFVNDNTGLGRNSHGQLFGNVGRIMALDEAFGSLSEKTSEAFFAQIESIKSDVAEFGKRALVQKGDLFFKDDILMIPYYEKVAKSVLANNVDYLKSELARLDRIVSSDAKHMERSALDYMQKRINILREVARVRNLL